MFRHVVNDYNGSESPTLSQSDPQFKSRVRQTIEILSRHCATCNDQSTGQSISPGRGYTLALLNAEEGREDRNPLV